MRAMTRAPLLFAVAMLLACAPARADRELFTFDCQGQIHIMAGTPVALSFRYACMRHAWQAILFYCRFRLE
jgi:hypothetical protein